VCSRRLFHAASLTAAPRVYPAVLANIPAAFALSRRERGGVAGVHRR